MTLTEFLIARIAEDEARVDGFFQGDDPDFYWGPDRIRAECETSRRIIELHAPFEAGSSLCETCADDGPYYDRGALEYPCPTLRALALPYAGHPDYDEAWRP